MQLTMDEKLVSQTAPISKTRIGTGRIISGLLVLFFNRKSQARERLHHTGSALYEKQSRDRQEALPRTRELAALVVTLPPGRGFHEKAGPCQAQNDFGSLNRERPSPTNGRRHTWAYHHER